MAHMQPNGKIDRSEWDNDPMPEEVRVTDLIAGDMIPGLGILDAILDPGLRGAGHDMVLCSGESARIVKWYDTVTVHAAVCPECTMHPMDCEEYGCGNDDCSDHSNDYR